jgi:hypothetical protein
VALGGSEGSDGEERSPLRSEGWVSINTSGLTIEGATAGKRESQSRCNRRAKLTRGESSLMVSPSGTKAPHTPLAGDLRVHRACK